MARTVASSGFEHHAGSRAAGRAGDQHGEHQDGRHHDFVGRDGHDVGKQDHAGEAHHPCQRLG
jgi:hypothetical protein